MRGDFRDESMRFADIDKAPPGLMCPGCTTNPAGPWNRSYLCDSCYVGEERERRDEAERAGHEADYWAGKEPKV
jgi:hypothetical protein